MEQALNSRQRKDNNMSNLPNAVCLICVGGVTLTGNKPRDRQEADIVVCNQCGHIQMFPLLTPEEEKEEYDNDTSVRFGGITDGSDFEAMRVRYSEWTKQHADIYFDILQNYENILEIGSGYGFFMEALNARSDRRFDIEGIEIGQFRLDNFVGGTAVHNINVLTDDIPHELQHKYDCIICMHVLEHISQPVLFLERIKALLKPGGNVIFEVPNINCLLGEISAEYKNFMYLYGHCSYFFEGTLRLVFEKAGYNVKNICTYEIYSVENHCRWVREGVPFTKYNQMFMPDEKLEWINRIYKDEIGKQGKGFALTIQANIK